MNGRLLLDTNIVIALIGNDAAVVRAIGDAETVFVPIVVIGELYFGAYKSARVHENLAQVAEFAAASTILGADVDTARIYGRVKNALREKGRPIPENDIWLAAIALQHDLTLVSRDDHFDSVVGLRTEKP